VIVCDDLGLSSTTNTSQCVVTLRVVCVLLQVRAASGDNVGFGL